LVLTKLSDVSLSQNWRKFMVSISLKCVLVCLTLVVFRTTNTYAIDIDTLKNVVAGTSHALNAINVLGHVKGGWDYCFPSEESKDKELDRVRRMNMEISGHECLGQVGDFRQCLPFRVQPGKFKYGADDKFDEDSTTNNVRRLCGNGVRPWCRFDVRNSNLVSEDPIQKNKTLRGYYNCVSPFDGRVISTHHVVFAEYSEAFLTCVDKDKTIFTGSKR
jgi:hypothetical protein